MRAGVVPSEFETPALSAAAVTSVAAMWPLAGPLLEMWMFSQKSPEEIEELVTLKEPVQVGR